MSSECCAPVALAGPCIPARCILWLVSPLLLSPGPLAPGLLATLPPLCLTATTRKPRLMTDSVQFHQNVVFVFKDGILMSNCIFCSSICQHCWWPTCLMSMSCPVISIHVGQVILKVITRLSAIIVSLLAAGEFCLQCENFSDHDKDLVTAVISHNSWEWNVFWYTQSWADINDRQIDTSWYRMTS